MRRAIVEIALRGCASVASLFEFSRRPQRSLDLAGCARGALRRAPPQRVYTQLRLLTLLLCFGSRGTHRDGRGCHRRDRREVRQLPHGSQDLSTSRSMFTEHATVRPRQAHDSRLRCIGNQQHSSAVYSRYRFMFCHASPYDQTRRSPFSFLDLKSFARHFAEISAPNRWVLTGRANLQF